MSIAKYRQLPIEHQAIRWTGDEDCLRQIVTLLLEDLYAVDPETNELVVKTLHGKARAQVGDWIIKRSDGDAFPIRDHIFRATYEEVDL